jgi:hypothetical protein
VLSLTIASWVCYRSVAYLRSKVSTICFEKIAGELRTIVGDDAVWNLEPAHEALDELDRRASWDGADGLYLRPLGEFADGDIEIAIAPSCSREWARMSSPQTMNGQDSGMVWRPWAG